MFLLESSVDLHALAMHNIFVYYLSLLHILYCIEVWRSAHAKMKLYQKVNWNVRREVCVLRFAIGLTSTMLFGNSPLIMFWLGVCSLKATTASAPASPVLVSKPRPLSMALPSSNSSPLTSPASPTDGPKKRRAPQPPILVSQSCPSEFSARQRLNSEPNAQLDSDQVSELWHLHSSEYFVVMLEWQSYDFCF